MSVFITVAAVLLMSLLTINADRWQPILDGQSSRNGRVLGDSRIVYELPSREINSDENVPETGNLNLQQEESRQDLGLKNTFQYYSKVADSQPAHSSTVLVNQPQDNSDFSTSNIKSRYETITRGETDGTSKSNIGQVLNLNGNPISHAVPLPNQPSTNVGMPFGGDTSLNTEFHLPSTGNTYQLPRGSGLPWNSYLLYPTRGGVIITSYNGMFTPSIFNYQLPSTGFVIQPQRHSFTPFTSSNSPNAYNDRAPTNGKDYPFGDNENNFQPVDDSRQEETNLNNPLPTTGETSVSGSGQLPQPSSYQNSFGNRETFSGGNQFPTTSTRTTTDVYSYTNNHFTDDSIINTPRDVHIETTTTSDRRPAFDNNPFTSVTLPNINNKRPSTSYFPNPIGGSPVVVQSDTNGSSKWATVAGGIQSFAYNLLHTFDRVPSTNVVFSPISIASIMSMLMIATKGRSQNELETALHIPQEMKETAIHSQYEGILTRLNNNGNGVFINTTSTIFFQDGVHNMYPLFENNVGRYYNCTISLQDFRTSPLQTMNNINDYIWEATGYMIRNFITSPFTASTQFVLVSTIHFKGEWETPFVSFFTKERDFYTGNEIIKVPMMSGLFEIPYIFNPYINADLIALPYKGKEFAMYIIVPRERVDAVGMDRLENRLTAELMETLISRMTIDTISVSLPKMKLRFKTSLRDSLFKLNVSAIFNPGQADFTRMTSSPSIWVDEVLHEAQMEITETGTIASAVSSVSLDRVGGHTRVVVNKPSLLFIRDQVTGVPLFWARVMKPDIFD